MMYAIVWRRKGTKSSWATYTEYKDIEGVKHIVDFLSRIEEYELVSITPYED